MTESIVSSSNINNMIVNIDDELNKIQPEIDYLSECLQKLNELKHKKLKLQTLKTSLQQLNNTISNTNKNIPNVIKNEEEAPVHFNAHTNNIIDNRQHIIFIPEEALQKLHIHLRGTESINHSLYQSIVFNGGEASTQQIKEYLIQNKIKQPKNKLPFDDIPLKEISSRVHYLVRKGLLTSITPGSFKTVHGWISEDDI